MKYIVNDSCIACGMCTALCEEVFSMGDGAAVAIEDEVPAEYEEAAANAMNSCPVSAIGEA